MNKLLQQRGRPKKRTRLNARRLGQKNNRAKWQLDDDELDDELDDDVDDDHHVNDGPHLAQPP